MNVILFRAIKTNSHAYNNIKIHSVTMILFTHYIHKINEYLSTLTANQY